MGQRMEVVAVFKRRAGQFLIALLLILVGTLIFRIVHSWQAVESLCTSKIIGLSEVEVIQHAKQLGLRYGKLSADDAIIIADMTPDGPDCRIIFDKRGVKDVEYNGHGYTRNR